MKIPIKTAGHWASFIIFLFFCSAGWCNAILEIRVGIHDAYTRLVLDGNQKQPFKITLADNMSQIRLSAPHLQFKGKHPNLSKTLIQNISFHSFRSGAGEFIFQTKKPIKILKSFVIPPSKTAPHFRYVIDIQEIKNSTIKNSTTVPLKKAPPPVKLTPEKKIIVIDPGHGGKDPGAKGRKGILEKDVTLGVAKLLQETLQKTNRYDVHLTRNKDCFLKLSDRIAIARNAKADFFISLHADSHPRPDTRGLSIYTLSKIASDAEAEKLAIKENKADLMDGITLDTNSPEVANILIDLMKRETMNLSKKGAHALVCKIRKRVLLLRNPTRSANFAVLRTPDLPAILIEMGYISNKQDEELLTMPEHQIKLCEGIREGIDHYFHEHK